VRYEYVLSRQIQEFLGPGAKPRFWFFNTLWGLDPATRFTAISLQSMAAGELGRWISALPRGRVRMHAIRSVENR